MKKRNYLLALAIAAALSITCFVGYGTPQKAAKTSSVITEDTASVTIEARNNDAKEIIEKNTDYGRTNYDDHVTDYGRTNYDNDLRYDD